MPFGLEFPYVIIWALVLLHTVLILVLLKQQALLTRMLQSGGTPATKRLPAGSPATIFRLPDLRTTSLVDSERLAGRKLLLFFLSEECSSCVDLAAALADVDVTGVATMVVLTEATSAETSRLAIALPKDIALVGDATATVARAYGVLIRPTIVVVDAERRIQRYAHPKTARDVEALARAGAAEPSPAQTVSLAAIENA